MPLMSLAVLRRPGLSQLERCLAASVLVGDIKAVLTRGAVSATWISLVHAEIQRHVGDSSSRVDLAGSNAEDAARRSPTSDTPYD